jgi:hypothetical protein
MSNKKKEVEPEEDKGKDQEWVEGENSAPKGQPVEIFYA